MDFLNDEWRECHNHGVLPISSFRKVDYPSGSFGYRCKICVKEWKIKNKEYLREYAIWWGKTSKKYRITSKLYRQKNKEIIKAKKKIFYQDPKNREKRIETDKKYRENNKEKFKEKWQKSNLKRKEYFSDRYKKKTKAENVCNNTK